MDGARKSDRDFPAYTLNYLKGRASDPSIEPAFRARLLLEIARREAGLSKPFIVPQIT